MMEDYYGLECYRESMLMDAPQANIYTLMGECQERWATSPKRENTTTAPWTWTLNFRDAHVGLGVSHLRCGKTGPPA